MVVYMFKHNKCLMISIPYTFRILFKVMYKWQGIYNHYIFEGEMILATCLHFSNFLLHGRALLRVCITQFCSSSSIYFCSQNPTPPYVYFNVMFDGVIDNLFSLHPQASYLMVPCRLYSTWRMNWIALSCPNYRFITLSIRQIGMNQCRSLRFPSWQQLYKFGTMEQ